MTILTTQQILLLHKQLCEETGGAQGLRDEGMLQSALSAPFQSFGGTDAYPSLQQKAARLAFGLVMRDILLKNGHLRDSARNNSLKDFRFAYFDAVQDALIAGYEQNQDFFALLLDNDEKKRELMQVFLEDVSRNLRT